MHFFCHSIHPIVPVLLLCGGLIILAVYLIHRSISNIWKQEAMIEKIRNADPNLALLYEEEEER